MLTVERLHSSGAGARKWLCRCSCGGNSVVPSGALLSGNTKSCGCRKRLALGDATRTHGQSNSRITGYKSRAYGIWQAMRDRCRNENRSDYHRYGGRGIFVSPRWDVFENFYADMGPPPVGKTLDRVDNDGPYSKNNCRWATRKEQSHNSTRVKFITVGDVTQPLAAWLEEAGIPRGTYYGRLKLGWSEAAAVQPRR